MSNLATDPTGRPTNLFRTSFRRPLAGDFDFDPVLTCPHTTGPTAGCLLRWRQTHLSPVRQSVLCRKIGLFYFSAIRFDTPTAAVYSLLTKHNDSFQRLFPPPKDPHFYSRFRTRGCKTTGPFLFMRHPFALHPAVGYFFTPKRKLSTPVLLQRSPAITCCCVPIPSPRAYG